MGLDSAERAARIVGAVAVTAAWLEAGAGIAAARHRRSGAASGLAARIGLMPTYLLSAVPYFIVACLLWRPLQIELDPPVRIAALAAGLAAGLVGIGLYVWGRRSLGPMYNVTGTFGAQVYAAHQLVASGPYRLVRHPMYLGIALGAVGGLLLYRTWTWVFVLAAAPGMVLRARAEERILADRLGSAYGEYRAATGMFLPQLRRRPH